LSSALAWAQEATTLPTAAPSPELIAQPSAPISIPIDAQASSTPAQPQTMRETLLLLRSKLVELKTLSREQTPALQTISGALSGAISLSESDSSVLSAQSTSVLSALSEATTLSTSASASLTSASSSQTEMTQAHEAEAAAATAVQTDLEAQVRAQRAEKAAWRTGALAAAAGFVGAAFGPTWAALGVAVGAAAGGAWWIFVP
jgi:hypothetical protein